MAASRFVAGRSTHRINRLSPLDLSNLRLESERSPFHFAGLVRVDGTPLLDKAGNLRLDEIKHRLDRRLTRVPELRRRLQYPGLLGGRPLWVDDDSFDIGNHVFEQAVKAPGGELQLLEAAAQLYEGLLDRSRPLWELWFLTGLGQSRVGVLLKLHHAVADGMAAVTTIRFLRLDLADVKSAAAGGLRQLLLSRNEPISRAFGREVVRILRQPKAPRTSLNRRVQPGRTLRRPVSSATR